MEPSDRWKVILLIFGIIIPVLIIVADLVWFSGDMMWIMVSLGWFGIVFFFVEGVRE